MGKLNVENPFLDGIKGIKTNLRTSVYAKGDTISVVDDSTGEVKGRGFNAIVREKQYDPERFVKLYKPGRNVLPELSVAATKVLWYLIGNMGYDDVISLNMEKTMKETGYRSQTMIYRAIAELKKHGVIANAYRNGPYYINPAMFYRGSRIKLIMNKPIKIPSPEIFRIKKEAKDYLKKNL